MLQLLLRHPASPRHLMGFQQSLKLFCLASQPLSSNVHTARSTDLGCTGKQCSQSLQKVPLLAASKNRDNSFARQILQREYSTITPQLSKQRRLSLEQSKFPPGFLDQSIFQGVSIRTKDIAFSKRHLTNGTRKTIGFSFLSVRSLNSTPLPFMLYGLGGLIPFASAPIYLCFLNSYDPSIASAQLVYGACILSFLGGVSWGNDLHNLQASFQSLGYSILLPLVGWTSVLIHPNPLSFILLMSGVVCAGYADTQYGDYPDWFKNLRFLLSSLVVLCLFSTFTLNLLKTPQEDAETAK